MIKKGLLAHPGHKFLINYCFIDQILKILYFWTFLEQIKVKFVIDYGVLRPSKLARAIDPYGQLTFK